MHSRCLLLAVALVVICNLTNAAGKDLRASVAKASRVYKTQLEKLKEKASPNGKKCSKRIVGYVRSWTPQRFKVRQSLGLTNVIYAFMDMDASGRLSLPPSATSQNRLDDLLLARQVHTDQGLSFKVSFAVGGWENSRYLSSVLSSGESRNLLINEIERIIEEYDLDGVDIDWEFPVTGGATAGKPEDRDNYVTFLRELRAKLGPDRLISLAAAAGQEPMAGFDVPKMLKYVDWIGVMCYDFFGAWDSVWGTSVGPNAPLRNAAPPSYSDKLNVDWAIKQYVCNGKDAGKVVMGMPFYGRFWYETQPPKDADYPMFRTAERLNNGSLGGAAATWELLNEGFEKHWDERSSTPWATKGQMFFSYENKRSVKAKVKYANEHNLGGVMIWAMDQDSSNYTLIDTVFKVGCHVGAVGAINYECDS